MRESILESPFTRRICGFGLAGTFVISSSGLSSDSSTSFSPSSNSLLSSFPRWDEGEDEDDEEEEDVDEVVVPAEEVLSLSLPSSALELSSSELSRELAVEVVSANEELELCLCARPLRAGTLERFEAETVEEGSISSSGRFLLVSSI